MNIIKKMNTPDFVIGLLGLIFGIIMYFYLIPATTPAPPASRFVDPYIQAINFAPNMWSIVIIISSFNLLFKSFINYEDENKIEINLKEYMPAILLIIIMLLYVIFLPIIGFITTSIITLFVSMILFGYKKLVNIVVLSIFFSLAINYFFEFLLNISLP